MIHSYSVISFCALNSHEAWTFWKIDLFKHDIFRQISDDSQYIFWFYILLRQGLNDLLYPHTTRQFVRTLPGNLRSFNILAQLKETICIGSCSYPKAFKGGGGTRGGNRSIMIVILVKMEEVLWYFVTTFYKWGTTHHPEWHIFPHPRV